MRRVERLVMCSLHGGFKLTIIRSAELVDERAFPLNGASIGGMI